ncbi:MAG: long-chain fatty acid--CoA ligase [Candidatus Dormibacteraeota bacterium]|nr:long-chain fatty acid--CoA ligase [Candidatus Dormibacteraeota bacterium]MBO0744459.1 long-chain fatty acid--CoA ligase [Candidatus Dormibacteraeota bacterium]
MDLEQVSDRTIPGLFLRQVAAGPERPFLTYYEGPAWRMVTYAQMQERVERAAAHLLGLGVGEREAVVLMAPNRLEWAVADLAIQLIGGVTAPIYPSSIETQVQAILRNCEARVALVEGHEREDRLHGVRTVRLESEFMRWYGEPATADQMAEIHRRAAAIKPDDLATIVYTSGTTGEPKGVEHAHGHLVDEVRQAIIAFPMNERDVSLSLLPLSHILERVSGFYQMIGAGSSAWLSRGSQHLLEDIAACRPTVMICVPRVYEKVYQGVMAEVAQRSATQQRIFRWALAQGRHQADTGAGGLSYRVADRLVLAGLRRRLTGGRLRYFISGGAPLLREVEAFFWAIGVKILQGWGLTETSSGTTANRVDDHRFETVGKPLPGVELRIADDGEILVKSPGNLIAYHHNPVATEEVLSDGWVHTGDIGEIDKDGFLHITDRKKDLLKTSGGKFVAPLQLEARLLQDSLLANAMVVGDLRPYVTALLVPSWIMVEKTLGLEGEPEKLVEDPTLIAALQEIVDRTNQDLASWETIKRFRVLPHEFSETTGELTPTLKVRRRVVLERHQAEIDEMYARPREEAQAAG